MYGYKNDGSDHATKLSDKFWTKLKCSGYEDSTQISANSEKCRSNSLD